MDTNYTHLRRLAVARAVVSLFASMETDDANAVAGLLIGTEDAEAECGITLEQRLRMIDIMEADVPGTVLAADLTKVITDNHGTGPFARTAAGIDLLQALRDVERHTRLNDPATVTALCGNSHEAKHTAAANAIFHLREIGRIVNPLIALLQSGAGNDAQAVAAE